MKVLGRIFLNSRKDVKTERRKDGKTERRKDEFFLLVVEELTFLISQLQNIGFTKRIFLYKNLSSFLVEDNMISASYMKYSITKKRTTIRIWRGE